ncbi:MAG: type I-C CRISPR-associated protein Cas5c [Candidatus Caenarcaniphilales bacterium]|nr:type I-C CRISPR-associated protein Cas5c [Candidatus Caenarcaniphilales bacterium]
MNHDNFRVKVSGDYACFTRPEMKVERVSYDVMTPSAARGVIEAILWKPAIRWVITQIDLLKPVRWDSFRRNEIANRAIIPPRELIERGGSAMLSTITIEEDRQQRASILLKDVAYVIHCHFEFSTQKGEDDNPVKFSEMFRRRLKKGQCHHQPYLGCREFSADFVEASPEDFPNQEAILEYYNRDLGYMLHDIDFEHHMTPRFFKAKLENGSMHVPAFNSAEVYA